MSLGVVARRDNPLWRAAARLARTAYRGQYGADIDPSPDLFAILKEDSREGNAPAPLTGAVAGLTFAGDDHLLSEYYLEDSVESVLAPRVGEQLQRSEICEVNALASTSRGAGSRLIGMVPMLAWCNGAKVIICTVTSQLAATLPRLGIDFRVVTPAVESTLPSRLKGSWGSYYDAKPVTGYVDVRPIGDTLLTSRVLASASRERAGA